MLLCQVFSAMSELQLFVIYVKVLQIHSWRDYTAKFDFDSSELLGNLLGFQSWPWRPTALNILMSLLTSTLAASQFRGCILQRPYSKANCNTAQQRLFYFEGSFKCGVQMHISLAKKETTDGSFATSPTPIFIAIFMKIACLFQTNCRITLLNVSILFELTQIFY